MFSGFRRRRKAFVFTKSCLFFFFHRLLFGSVSVLFCVVVVVFVFTTRWFVVWFVFLCGFVFWFGFCSDFAVDDSLVNMDVCCGSVVSVVDACCDTSLFTSLVV